jgi:hypothetical protein
VGDNCPTGRLLEEFLVFGVPFECPAGWIFWAAHFDEIFMPRDLLPEFLAIPMAFGY